MSTLLFSSLQIKTPKKIPFPKINGWDEKELCSWNVPQSFAPFLSSRVCGQKLRPDQCPPSWKDESGRWRQSRSHHLARSSCSPAPSPLESICPQTCAHSRQLWAQQAASWTSGSPSHTVGGGVPASSSAKTGYSHAVTFPMMRKKSFICEAHF